MEPEPTECSESSRQADWHLGSVVVLRILDCCATLIESDYTSFKRDQENVYHELHLVPPRVVITSI
jgi:hypothetical protein